MPRRKLNLDDDPKPRIGSYFLNDKVNLEFIKSGCTLLDAALGGGFPLGRVSNIIGDKSTGKTLLAIEAATNFAHKYPTGKIYYREAEAAFDPYYAEALGMPLNRVDISKDNEFDTVEQFFDDLNKVTDELIKSKHPCLYIVDSLDALSDQAELDEDFDKGSYGTAKAKAMSKLFRQLVRKIHASRCHLMIISQIRDKIGVTFGKKTTRSGGRALDFYATHVVTLSQVKLLDRTVKGVTRPIGVRIRAKIDKNKISLPFRECDFEILFAYGIDDIAANLEWLKTIGRLDEILNGEKSPAVFINRIERLPTAQKIDAFNRISKRVTQLWRDIDQDFLPVRSKWG